MTRQDFIDRYRKIALRAARFGEVARGEGILSLDNEVWDVDEDDYGGIFKKGIILVIDGIAYEVIDKILTNLVSHEKDEEKRVLKTVQKEAALMIQQGYNVRIMLEVLNSYVDLTSCEIAGIMKDFNEAAEEAAKEAAAARQAEQDADPDFINREGKLAIMAKMTDRDIQAVLRNVDSRMLAAALKGEGKKAHDAVFRNMSGRAVAMLKEDMEYMGYVDPDDVDEAQDQIVSIIKQLAESGEIERVNGEGE
jgi:flagellar motor switch protein FliG